MASDAVVNMLPDFLRRLWAEPNDQARAPAGAPPATWRPTAQERDVLFPAIDPGLAPFGSRVLVQIKVPKRMVGSLILPEQRRDTDRDNTQIALIRAMGPLAFHNRASLAAWPEGRWCATGDVVLVPRFGQNERWQITHEGEPVEFRLYDDVAMLGFVTAHPNDTSWGG